VADKLQYNRIRFYRHILDIANKKALNMKLKENAQKEGQKQDGNNRLGNTSHRRKEHMSNSSIILILPDAVQSRQWQLLEDKQMKRLCC
jgi:hypothetical protein